MKRFTLFANLKSLECTYFENLQELVEAVLEFDGTPAAYPTDIESAVITCKQQAEIFCKLQDKRRENRNQ